MLNGIDLAVIIGACGATALPWLFALALPRESKARIWASAAALPLSTVFAVIGSAVVIVWLNAKAGMSC